MKRFTVRDSNHGFRCVRCGTQVTPLAHGSVRNHCPACLWSLHVDVFPGDRASDCGAPLEPIAVRLHAKKGPVIVHRCSGCGALRNNRAATDDPVQADDMNRLIDLSTRPAPDA
ncbi:MAG: RNHCP domain-containing protein [Trueperaceae bacterium]